jgi:hypothetical protein
MDTIETPAPWSLLAEGLLGWDLARSAVLFPALALALSPSAWRTRPAASCGLDVDELEAAVAQRERARPLRVPVTAIYSRRDGVVAWRACIDSTNADVEHVEVSSTHRPRPR